MRVAILGMGPSADTYARHAAGMGERRKAFDEVWTVNAFGSIFISDRVFHMDDIRIQQIRADAGNTQIANLLDYLQDAPGPIYTSRALSKEPNPDFETVEKALADLDGEGQMIPRYGMTERQYLDGVMRWMLAEKKLQARGGFEGLVPYPLPEVLSNTGGPPYFTSTTPYAIAMALAGKAAGLPEDVTWLAMFGIDYSHINAIKAEVGRACCEFWLGRCIERDIKLQMPADTWLLGTSSKHRLYGYDTQSVSVSFDEDEHCSVIVKNKPAPTAEEVEEDYSHHKMASETWSVERQTAA
jgi:hypothetical protein